MANRKGLVCWQCEKPTLVKNIGEERTRYPFNKQEVLCKTCQRQNVENAIRETRERMGLQR